MQTINLSNVSSIKLTIFPPEMLLKTILADNTGTINHSPGDGYCLLHSTISSFTSQLPFLAAPPLFSLKADIRNHIDLCSAEYFISGFDGPSIKHQMHLYIMYKDYNLDFVDIAPSIIARLLKVGVEILDSNSKDVVTHYSFEPPSLTPTVLSYITVVITTTASYL